MWIEMKGILVTVFLLIVTIGAQINLIKLFSGSETPLPWPINIVIKIGSVSTNNQNLTELDLKASKNAIELSELLREKFDVGIFPLPPLDPYRSNSRKRIILSPQQFVNGSINVNSVTTTGAKQFYLKDFQLRLNTGRIDFKIAIGEIRIIINNFETNLFVNGRPMNMQLKLSIFLDDLNLSGAFQTKKALLGDLENKSIIQVVGSILAINISEVRVAIEFDPRIDFFTSLRYLNQISSLQHLGWENMKGDVERYLLEAAMEQINDILRNFSVEQVEAFLLSPIKTKDAENEKS